MRRLAGVVAGGIGLLVVGMAGVGSPEVAAQVIQASAAKREATRKLDFMIGRWQGTGWWQMGPRRQSFRSEETITPRAGGMALELLGRHFKQDGDAETIIHDAFAMVWWDEASQSYRMKSALQNGLIHEFELTLTADGYTWSHPLPDGRGRMRYVATIGPATWREAGEFSADGQAWKPAFEMNLKRVE